MLVNKLTLHRSLCSYVSILVCNLLGSKRELREKSTRQSDNTQRLDSLSSLKRVHMSQLQKQFALKEKWEKGLLKEASVPCFINN